MAAVTEVMGRVETKAMDKITTRVITNRLHNRRHSNHHKASSRHHYSSKAGVEIRTGATVRISIRSPLIRVTLPTTASRHLGTRQVAQEILGDPGMTATWEVDVEDLGKHLFNF